MSARRRGHPGEMTEAELQNLIISLADLTGWRHFHAPDNRPSGNTGRVQRVTPGWPDLTLVRGTRLIFAELKTEKGRVSPEQEVWLAELAAIGQAVAFLAEQAILDGPHPSIETYVWRPSDWPAVQQLLAQRGNRPTNVVDHGQRPTLGRAREGATDE